MFQYKKKNFYNDSFSYFSHICTGNIINDQWILTARNCVFLNAYLKNYLVIVGLHNVRNFSDSQKYEIIKVVSPTDMYHKTDKINDVVLLKLKSKIKFDSKTAIIDISVKKSKMYMNKCLVTAGWGTNDSSLPEIVDELQETNVKIISETISVCHGMITPKIMFFVHFQLIILNIRYHVLVIVVPIFF